jgi:WD40 repeat protein
MMACNDVRVFPLESMCISVAFGEACLAVGQANGDFVLFGKDKGCLHKLRGHQSGANSLAFSSNRQQQQQLLASGSADGTVQLWDTHTRECAGVLEGHTRCVMSVAFSPDSRLLASASDDRTVRLWDVVERRVASPVHVLRGHAYVSSLSFSPDGRQLASGSWDCTVRLWSVPECVPGPVLQHACPVYCVAFLPVVGSNMLASGDSHGIVRLWDVGGIIKRELQGHSRRITSVVFSPDGSQLVTGSDNNTVRLWSVASGKLVKVLTGNSVRFQQRCLSPQRQASGLGLIRQDCAPLDRVRVERPDAPFVWERVEAAGLLPHVH